MDVGIEHQITSLCKSYSGNLVSAAQMAAQLGVVKMGEYLITGTKHQFWEENFVKGLMQV